MAKRYHLEFEGYYVESKWGSLRMASGIYCVYATRRSPETGNLTKPRLLYIGEAENIRDRVPEDPEERRDKWEEELRRSEFLCVSFALIEGKADRKQAEAAMIYQHQPPCNEMHKDSYSFPRTTISTSGKNVTLSKQFTLEEDHLTTRQWARCKPMRWTAGLSDCRLPSVTIRRPWSRH